MTKCGSPTTNPSKEVSMTVTGAKNDVTRSSKPFQINHQPDATIFPVYYPEVYLELNMFRAFSRPSSGAQ
jgi:hypothetical protein